MVLTSFRGGISMTPSAIVVFFATVILLTIFGTLAVLFYCGVGWLDQWQRGRKQPKSPKNDYYDLQP